MNIDDKFLLITKKINNEIKKNFKKTPTLNFKLNSFKILYDTRYGLFNNPQKSGSCTFYSYFNLAINNLLINLYLEGSEEYNYIKKYIYSVISFHRIMIYLFCISNDTKYIKDITKSNDYFNNTYIYNLCDKYNLTDEILSIYDSETFILNNKNKCRIDSLFNYKINGDFQILESYELNYSYYFKLKTFIKIKILEIRNDTNTYEVFKTIFTKDIFTNFYERELKPLLIDKFHNTPMFKNFLSTLIEIYYIYLLILKKIYINNIKIDFNFREHTYIKLKLILILIIYIFINYKKNIY